MYIRIDRFQLRGLIIALTIFSRCALASECAHTQDVLRRAPFAGDCAFQVGCNYWASHAGVYMWRRWDEAVVKEDLRQLADHGMSVIRIFPLWSDFQPLNAEFGARGLFHNYTQGGDRLKNYAAVDEVMVSRLCRVCDLAEEKGLRVVIGLVTGWMSGRMFAPQALERMNALTDCESIKWQCRYVRYLVDALKQHSAIQAWDLGNECNCMGTCTEAELWNWMHAISSEIRLSDPSRKVISGMHGISSKRNAIKSLHSQCELVDVMTTHPYPLWTKGCNTEPYDSIRNGCHAACETVYYSDLTRLVGFVEEAGSMGPGIVSEERAASSLRASLFSCWSAGIPAFLWWCSYDFDKLDFAPYGWTAIERELGLFRSDRSPKPTVLQMRAFAEFLKTLPFERLPPRQVDAVVLVSENEDFWLNAFGAWTLSREAGFDVAYAFAESELPNTSLYILPSGNISPDGSLYETYSSEALRRIWEKVYEGASVLVTLGDGAVMPGLRDVAGVEVECQYQKPCLIKVEIGNNSFSIAESQTRRVSARGAKLLVADASGWPLLTENAYGKGRVIFVNAALERNAKIDGWPIYKMAAACAGIRRIVRKDSPCVGVSEHPAGNGRAYAVLVNYSSESVRCKLEVDGDVKRIYGAATFDGDVIVLRANDGCVMEVEVN